MKLLFKFFVSIVFVLVMASCGSDEDRCFNCVLNATDVDVCESNYRATAGDNFNSLEEYIEEVRGTGFVCTEL